MPTYEYKCDDCGHVFEAFQSMTAERLTECPVCSGHVRRLIGKGAGIIFKGSGFYETDYKRASSAPAAPACGRDKPCCGAASPCKSSCSAKE